MKKKWYRLDNAALMFPAIVYRNWSNVFRVSITLKDNIVPEILKQAINNTRKRFPTFFVRLSDGLFWHYLVECKTEIEPIKDYAYPLTFMSNKDLHKKCIRVLYYKNRIALEIFHAVTDGNGGILLLKNIAAEYLRLKENITISNTCDIYDLNELPKEEEIDDGFLKIAKKYSVSQKESKAFKYKGTREERKFKNLITGVVDTKALIDEAHKYNVTVTSYLAAVLAESFIEIQASRVKPNKQKAVKITVPVNLRKLFGINTFRNFVLVVHIGVDPKLGEFSFKELCDQMNHQLKIKNTKQVIGGVASSNVQKSKFLLMRLVPSFIKDFVLDLVYRAVGEVNGCITLSNLGNASLPEEMSDQVERMEFITGPQVVYPNNCSVISYKDKTYINMIRTIKEADLERLFFSKLVEHGIPVLIETNIRR